MLTKEEVIKELQKYSKEIGGKTPGEKAFYAYFGIKLYDLRKLGWVNWGELVVDAGLTPNKFDKTKYTQEQLCKLFIETVREKGKWPTRGDLEVKHHKDSNFPEPGTFYDKLGLVTNGKLAKTILEYIGNKKGYNNIIEICEPFLNETAIQEDSSFTDKGCVYLLKSTLRNAVAYKIGKTKNIENRKKQLRQPSNIDEILHYIETDDALGVEKYWHNRFAYKRLYPDRLKDEWFKLTPSDIKAFKRWKNIF